MTEHRMRRNWPPVNYGTWFRQGAADPRAGRRAAIGRGGEARGRPFAVGSGKIRERKERMVSHLRVIQIGV